MTKRNRRSRAQPGNRPEFRFVTIEHPDEFRKEKNKKDIRSQAMLWHRERQRKEAAAAEVSFVQSTSPEYDSVEMPLTPPYEVVGQAEQYLPLSLADVPSQQFSVAVVQSDFRSFSYSMPHAESFDHNPTSRVTGYQAHEGHEHTMAQMLLNDFATHHYQFVDADGQGPRDVFLPTFDLSSAEYLLKVLMRMFTTSSMLHKWFPAMRKNWTLIQSAAVFASAWDDLENGSPMDSKRTTMLRNCAWDSLCSRQVDPDLRFDDTSLTMLLHLMLAEFWSCDETMLQPYEARIIRNVSERGGLQNVDDRTVAEFCAVYCYHSAITRETAAHTLLQDWVPPVPSKHDTTPFPESPLFCPASDFAIITCDPCCSTATQDIIRTMRDLTNLFIREMGPHVDKHVKKEELDDKHYTEVLIRYGNKSHEIRNHVLTLPSAREQGHLCSGDWVYEACRIAAVIYAEAIVEQQDFSTVGDHLYDREAFRTYIQYSTCPLPTDTLVGKLYEALEHTDLDNIWGDMAGVLYWVCTVGTTAAPKGDSMWLRRFLGKHAARTMCILVPPHPTPMRLTQRRLHEVQKLIRDLSIV